MTTWPFSTTMPLRIFPGGRPATAGSGTTPPTPKATPALSTATATESSLRTSSGRARNRGSSRTTTARWSAGAMPRHDSVTPCRVASTKRRRTTLRGSGRSSASSLRRTSAQRHRERDARGGLRQVPPRAPRRRGGLPDHSAALGSVCRPDPVVGPQPHRPAGDVPEGRFHPASTARAVRGRPEVALMPKQRVGIRVEDTEIDGVLHLPEMRAVGGAAVLHGFGGHPDQPHIVATCESLARTGVAALRFAYRDHQPPRMTLGSGLADAAGAIRVLKAHPDIPERLAVVGFSFGGTAPALVAGRDSRIRGSEE